MQENEDEKLTKEEQDKAWEVYRKSLEWEEVHRVPLDETGKPSVAPNSTAPPEDDDDDGDDISFLSQTPAILKKKMIYSRRFMQSRRCTNLAHLLTLRSQGTKIGCTTICGECAQEISWESLHSQVKAS